MASCLGFCRRIWNRMCYCFARLSQCLRKFWNGTKGCFTKKEEEKHAAPTCENIFHKEKIMMFGNILTNTSLPIAKRAQAVQKIGLLAFTGGPSAGQFASGYMKEAADLMENEQLSVRAKVHMLQGLACWCYLNPESQKKAMDFRFTRILIGFIDATYSIVKDELKGQQLHRFWACYALSIITCNNLPLLKELKEMTSLKYHLQMLASENWSGWPENFAEVLYFLIGFHKN